MTDQVKPPARKQAVTSVAKTKVAAKVAAAKPVAAGPAKAAPAAKVAPKTTPKAKAAKPMAAPAAEAVKAKKPKMVRDSLTMPKAEYEVLANLKARATALQHHAKKTELIRAGIQALAAMADAAFLASIKAVPSLKTGRPKKA
ncbi:MAG: hypothetical protein ACR2I0_10840 [Rhodoferax sp.]